jgi:hypothetical protein
MKNETKFDFFMVEGENHWKKQVKKTDNLIDKLENLFLATWENLKQVFCVDE